MLAVKVDNSYNVVETCGLFRVIPDSNISNLALAGPRVLVLRYVSLGLGLGMGS